MNNFYKKYRNLKLSYINLIHETSKDIIREHINSLIFSQRIKSFSEQDFGDFSNYSNFQERFLSINQEETKKLTGDLNSVISKFETLYEEILELFNSENYSNIGFSLNDDSNYHKNKILDGYKTDLELRKTIVNDLISEAHSNSPYEVLVTLLPMWSSSIYINDRVLSSSEKLFEYEASIDSLGKIKQ